MKIVSFLNDSVLYSYFKTTKDCRKIPAIFDIGYNLQVGGRYCKAREPTGTPLRNKPPTALETKTEQAG